MHRKITGLFLSILVSVTLLLAGCGSGVTTPADTSAGTLDVTITIQDDLANPSGLTPLVVAFRKNGTLVQFANSETITCDGVALTMFSDLLGYVGGVPNHVPAGGAFTFVYTSQGVTTTF